MSNINNISSDLLLKTVKEILEKADLNVMTPKIVRNELQIRLKVNDLSSRKQEISAFIMDVINDINNNNNNSNNKSNSNGDNETNTNTNQTDSYLKSGSTLASNSKQSPDFNEDSDSSSDESICDEELARKLQKEEEIDAKQRVTRSNRSTNNRKKTKTNKSKKRKTDKSDNSFNEKSQKKAKNGYLKPCLLSPILADFLGENEMPRHEVVKRIWSYVKEKNLLDPKNKQFAICDNELLKIFDRKRIRLFGMMKHLTKHLQ